MNALAPKLWPGKYDLVRYYDVPEQSLEAILLNHPNSKVWDFKQDGSQITITLCQKKRPKKAIDKARAK